MGKLSGTVGRVLDRARNGAAIRAMDRLRENDLALGRLDLETLEAARPGLRAQLVAMAAEFGVAEADIDRDRWRALEIVHACTGCNRSKACFRYLSGKANTGFEPRMCPNAAQYEDLASRGRAGGRD